MGEAGLLDQNFRKVKCVGLTPHERLLETPLAGTAYDEANEMLSFGGATLTYDPNGNLSTRTDACGTTTYTWDARNRLTGISGYKPDCSPLNASFSHDALGRRTAKTINSVITQYVYDGSDIIKEITGSVTTNYTRTLNVDEPLAFERSDGTIRYYTADALGSIVALTDGTGVVKTTYTYDAFGNVTGSGEASTNPFQYTGRENDGTGLYYYRARYYSPEMRRFISEDPVGLVGGINYFAYVQNNPVNFIDMFGLKKESGCKSCEGEIMKRIIEVRNVMEMYSSGRGHAVNSKYRSYAETKCTFYGPTTDYADDIPDCIRECVVEHENVHHKQCWDLGPSKYKAKMKIDIKGMELPAYIKELRCLEILLRKCR